MSLLKIPLILVGTTFAHISASAPNPSAKDDDLKSAARERFAFGIAVTYKGLIWGSAVAESALILSRHFPAIAQILSKLIPPATLNAATKLRITPYYLIGWALVCSAGWLRRTCYRVLGRFFTFDVIVLKDHQLVTTGPYAWVRHPSYTGVLLCGLGLTLIQLGGGSLWTVYGESNSARIVALKSLYLALTVLFPLVLLKRMNVEDAMLRDAFPEEWSRWAKKTPYRLIPYLY